LDWLFLLLLLFKHAFADLPLQHKLRNIDKLKYFGNGHIHYLHHGILTLLVSVFFTTPILAIIIALIDYILHWHIDFCKHLICKNKIRPVETNSIVWWYITAVDQCLHYSGYVLLVLFFR